MEEENEDDEKQLLNDIDSICKENDILKWQLELIERIRQRVYTEKLDQSCLEFFEIVLLIDRISSHSFSVGFALTHDTSHEHFKAIRR